MAEQPAPLKPAPITHRAMLALAVPMMLAHATEPLLGFVDTALIGQLGDAALLGGVALGAVVFDLLFWTFGSLRMTTIGLTAQAVGAGDRAEADRVHARALAMGLLIGLAMVALQGPIGRAVSALSGASEGVNAALVTYFSIRIWGAPAVFANYVMFGALRGHGAAGYGLAMQMGLNLTNVALSVLFIMGLGWGVFGAALGTVMAEFVGVALGFVFLRRLGTRFSPIGARATYRRAALFSALASNRDVMVRNLMMMVAFTGFTRTGATLGDITLAANAILQNLWFFGSYMLDGFASAAETLCGMAVGARRRHDFARAVRLALLWTVGIGAIVALLTFGAGPAFIRFVSTNEAVRAAAIALLPLAAITPLLGAPAFAFDGIFTGANWTAAMRNQSTLATIGFLALLFLLLEPFGNSGLWAAFLGFMVLRGALQAALYPKLFYKTFPDQAEPMKMPAMSTSAPPTTT